MSDATIAEIAYLNGSGVRLDGTYYVLLGGPQGVTRTPMIPSSSVATTYGDIDYQSAGHIGNTLTFTVACTSWSQTGTLISSAAKASQIDFLSPWGDHFTNAVFTAITEGKMRSDIDSANRWNYTVTIKAKV